MDELSGKVAIVSGATRMRGPGRAIATTLARAGANVIVTDSDSHTPISPERCCAASTSRSR